MSYGGGSVVVLSSSDCYAWLAGAAGSSKYVERGVPNEGTTRVRLFLGAAAEAAAGEAEFLVSGEALFGPGGVLLSPGEGL